MGKFWPTEGLAESSLYRIFDNQSYIFFKICGNVYKQIHNLNLHMKTHDPKNEITCDMCGKKYATKELITHIKHKIFYVINLILR